MKNKFVMECYDKIKIPTRGWVVVGKVINGIAKTSSEVLLIDNKNIILEKGIIIGIEINRKLHCECRQGQVVGLLFKNLNLDGIEIENKYIVSTNISMKPRVKSNDLKERISALQKVANHMDEILERPGMDSETEIINDMRDFLIFLALANKDVLDKELEYINSTLGLNLDRESVFERYYNSDVSNSMFYKIPPHSFFSLVFMEGRTVKNGVCNEFFDVGEKYIKVFEIIGQEFIVYAQEVDESRIINYIKYLYELKKYLVEQTGKSIIYIDNQLCRMDGDGGK